jgi:phosphoserine aminotransferase
VITFYPGPSKIDERLPKWLNEGLESGMLSMNHRSQAFMQQYDEIIDLFGEVFHLPNEYEVYFTSSATECWEIISQSFHGKSFLHVYNGAFGEKWLKMDTALGNDCRNIHFEIDQHPPIPESIPEDIICLTHNETSNGTRLPDKYMVELREKFPDKIIAADATSSMAGVMLPWLAADIWYASVQKCFGLPAGMAVMFVHNRVLDMVATGPFYNQISNLHRNFVNLQTTHTPNVANVYYLWQFLQDHKGLELKSEKIRKRAKHIYRELETLNFDLLIADKKLRSDTVIAVRADEKELPGLFEYLESKNVIIGKGYGSWKKDTFRIANFPAIKRHEFDTLFKQLKKWREQR